jgi:hypothetical protein
MQDSVKQYAEGVFHAHGVPVQIRLAWIIHECACDE